MEANGMNMTDYLVLEKVGNRHRGISGTALGFGVGALALGIAGLWGVNAASQARSRSAELTAAANSDAIKALAAIVGQERSSREDWQRRNQPTIGQYVDVQTNPNLNAQVQDIVSAMASAQATANNTGINSAVGSENFLRVQHYSAPQPCGCGCNG